MKRLYLALAVVGAIAPTIFFFQFFASEGIHLGSFVSAVFDNTASGGIAADLMFSSLVFWLAMFRQKGKGKGPNPIPFIVLNLLIGLSCAVPAYLYARESLSERAYAN